MHTDGPHKIPRMPAMHTGVSHHSQPWKKREGRNCKPTYCRDKISPFCLCFHHVLCQLITIPIHHCEEDSYLPGYARTTQSFSLEKPVRFPAPLPPQPPPPQCHIPMALEHIHRCDPPPIPTSSSKKVVLKGMAGKLKARDTDF